MKVREKFISSTLYSALMDLDENQWTLHLQKRLPAVVIGTLDRILEPVTAAIVI